MSISTEFDNYIVYHEEKPGLNQKVAINCFMEDKTVGYITFVDGDVPPPEVLHTGAVQLYFPYSRFQELMTTIRYEKPLYLSVYGDKSVLSTVHEPVGEQEGIPGEG
jgi:hypothetical protein